MVFAAQGEVLAGARITIEGTARATLTDSLGSDTFPASPAGAARVRVFSTGLAPETATVVITAGQPARHDFTRRPLGEDPAPGRSPLKRAKFVVASSRALAGAAIAIHDPRFASDLARSSPPTNLARPPTAPSESSFRSSPSFPSRGSAARR